MPLQDLTPQLRTRLSRLERVVGWFVTIATLLLAVGLVYYVYKTAESRGWFLKKMPYFTFVRDATGLKIKDPVKLMGFEAGWIVDIVPQPPDDPSFNVFVQFRIKEPYYGYLWEDSRAKVAPADFLGKRSIEVSKGTNGAPTYLLHQLKEVTLSQAEELTGSKKVTFAQTIYDQGQTNVIIRAGEPLTKEALQKISGLGLELIQVVDHGLEVRSPKWMWDDRADRYRPIQKGEKGYWLPVEESPALTERLEKVVNIVEAALPNILDLTNQLSSVLTNSALLATHADDLLLSIKPAVTNLEQITANLRGPKGSLCEWLIPTNLNLELQTTLGSANSTVLSAQTNLNLLSSNLLASLENLADLTGNLHAQVEANGLILSEISDLVVHTDQMVQGLKRHWLLKSAFRQSTNAPVRSILKPRVGGSQ